MLNANQTPRRCELSTEQLRLVCELSADRWQHTVSILSDGKWEEVLTSLEGSPQDELPASPVFQELLLDEKHPHLAEVQMFGRSGKCLYAVAAALNTATKTLDFDVSARFGGTAFPAKVTSTYSGGHWTASEETTRIARETTTGLSLTILDVPGMPSCEFAADPAEALQIGYGDLSAVRPATGGTTIRWHYQISYADLS